MHRISFRIAEGVEVYLDGAEEMLDDGATVEKEDGAAVVFTVTVPENTSASVKAEENEIVPGDDGSYSVNADRDQTVDVSYTAAEEAGQDEENVTEPEDEEKDEKDSEEAGEAVGTATVQDVTISVKPSNAEGEADALPEGYQVTAEAVDAEAIIASVEEQLEDGLSVLDARAFNITILDADGNEIQPEGGVTVSISGTGLEGERFAVAHMADSADAAELIGTDYDSADVTFTAESFSDYAVLALADYRIANMALESGASPIAWSQPQPQVAHFYIWKPDYAANDENYTETWGYAYKGTVNADLRAASTHAIGTTWTAKDNVVTYPAADQYPALTYRRKHIIM